MERYAERFLAVCDVPGNHYGYDGTDWDTVEPPALSPSYRFGATLADDTLTAAILRADFQRENPIVEEWCRVGMNDFHQIRGITVEKVKARHREHLACFQSHIQPGGIVMTHFAPSWQSISPEYGSHELNDYDSSSLEDLIPAKRPALWVRGHIHSRRDYRVGETRMICNPAGYDGIDHDPRLRIELP